VCAAAHDHGEDNHSDIMALDEAANVQAEDGEDGTGGQLGGEGMEFGQEFNFGSKPLSRMLRLTTVEQVKWKLGFPLPTEEIARRLFGTLDYMHRGSLPLSALDFIVKQLQLQLPCSKETFDLAEVRLLPSKCSRRCHL
jgi:hypothetical protein